MFPTMTLLPQTGSGMISARVGRCGPKSDFLSINRRFQYDPFFAMFRNAANTS
jgi:carbohydrate-selective porin OprB